MKRRVQNVDFAAINRMASYLLLKRRRATRGTPVHGRPGHVVTKARFSLWRCAWVALASLLLAGPATAVPVTWTLVGVTFEDGGTAVGSYVFNADTAGFSDISIVTSPNPTLGLGATYGVATGVGTALFFDTVESFPLTGTDRLLFDLVSPMTNAGGTIAINLASQTPDAEGTCTNADCSFIDPFRLIVSGSITTVVTPVPEPSALVLFAAALAGLVLSLRRKAR